MDSSKWIDRRMRDLTISDKDLFASRVFSDYLRTMLNVLSRRRHILVPPVHVRWLPKEPWVAYTDTKAEFLNAGHPAVDSMCSSREERALLLMGLLSHEFGHTLWTDDAAAQSAVDRLGNSIWYPPLPDDLPEDLQAAQEDVLAFVQENPLCVRALERQWHDLWNRLEDSYIEERQLDTLKGLLLKGLKFLRSQQERTSMSYMEMLDKFHEGVFDLCDVVLGLVLIYAKYGVIKADLDDPEVVASEPMQYFYKIIPYIDSIFREDASRKRIAGVHLTFLALWPIYKARLTKLAETIKAGERSPDDFREGSACDGDMGSESSTKSTHRAIDRAPREAGTSSSLEKRRAKTKRAFSPSPEADASDTEEATPAPREADDEAPDAPTPILDESAVEPSDTMPDSDDAEEGYEDDAVGMAAGEEDTDDSSADSKDGPATVEDAEEGGSDSSCETTGDADDGTPTDDADAGDDDSEMDEEEERQSELDGIREMAEVLSKMDHDTRREIAESEANDLLTDELQKAATDLDYGTAHLGIQPTVTRRGKASAEVKARYAAEMGAIEKVSKLMAKRVMPALKRKQLVEDMPLTGFYSGARFDATRLVREDCRYFRNNHTPMPKRELVLSILVDESGSMGMGGRINVTRGAALALYLFAQEVGIPCSVLGHTANFFDPTSLRIESYADFDAPDGDDKYRIMGISNKQDNRDGPAIWYAGQRLLQRPEATKLLVVISDGKPCAMAYSGPAAQLDVAGTVAELRRQGLVIFAAAIGDDKPDIQRMYGEGFLDIQDLSALPDQLYQLVRRYIH